jgi:hypothetical protein
VEYVAQSIGVCGFDSVRRQKHRSQTKKTCDVFEDSVQDNHGYREHNVRSFWRNKMSKGITLEIVFVQATRVLTTTHLALA